MPDNRLTPEVLADILAVGREVIHTLQAAKALARDPKEPGVARKKKFDAKLEALVKRHFAGQAEQFKAALESRYPDRKAVTVTPKVDDLFDWDDPEFDADLVILLTQAAKDGIILFSEKVTIGMDYTLTNTRAADWARKYSYELVKGIDDTTRQALQSAISNFVETPGMTIGDTMNQLPFSGQRSVMVATTEITRAYAQANQLAGEDLSKAYPDVKVTKRWFTNRDDLVCDICEPMNGEEVDIDEPFSSGDDVPPAHVNCRCWTSVGTRLIND